MRSLLGLIGIGALFCLPCVAAAGGGAALAGAAVATFSATANPGGVIGLAVVTGAIVALMVTITWWCRATPMTSCDRRPARRHR